jgi:hypothetical protein
MRLQSNFKDYYDAALKYGSEPVPVYNRFRKEVKVDETKHPYVRRMWAPGFPGRAVR